MSEALHAAPGGGALRIVRKLAGSSSIQSAMMFGFSGVAFTVGNLLLARELTVEDFGRYTLAVAIFNVLWLLAPLGLDEMSLRRRIDPSPRLLAAVTGRSAIAALAALLIAVLFYRLSWPLGLAIAVGVVGGGASWLGSAMLRRVRRERLAFLLTNTHNIAVLLGGLICLVVLPLRDPLALMGLLAVCVALGAFTGWRALMRDHRVPEEDREPPHWREAFSFMGIAAAGTLTLQLERLVAPLAVGVEGLATFAVLASVAIFPFRMVRSGLGFSLTPRMRAARTVAERWKLLTSELVAVSVVMVVGTAGVLLLAAPVTAWLTDGRYHLTLLLVVAGCLNGIAKVVSGLPRAIVTACGTAREVGLLNIYSWIGIAAGLAGAWLGASAGVEGLILGSGLGSLIAAVPALLLARRSMLRPPA